MPRDTQVGVRVDDRDRANIEALRTAWTGPIGTPSDSDVVREALRRCATAEAKKKTKKVLYTA